MKAVGIIIEGTAFPLGSDEDIEVLYNRLYIAHNDDVTFTFHNKSGEKHIIPPWALSKVIALVEGTSPDPPSELEKRGASFPRKIQ
jgi:hypothetical protein